MLAEVCKPTTFWNKNPNQNRTSSIFEFKVEQATCRTPTKNRAEWLLEAAGTSQSRILLFLIIIINIKGDSKRCYRANS